MCRAVNNIFTLRCTGTCEALSRTGEDGVLSVSWIVCLLRRVFAHESAFIRRWGFRIICDHVDPRKFPCFEDSFYSFLTESLPKILADSSLFHKYGSSALMVFLFTFFHKFLLVSDERQRDWGTAVIWWIASQSS